MKQKIREFYFFLQGNGRASCTCKSYRNTLEKFASLYPLPLNEVTPTHLQDYLAPIPTAPSRNQAKCAIRSFFAWCVDAGYLDKNPAR